MTEPKIEANYTAPTGVYLSKNYEPSEWVCYLFGSTKDSPSITYCPREGAVPNWFARWMMKVFFDCTWEKVKK